MAVKSDFQQLKEEVEKNLATLKNGNTFELKNQMLASLFRASVQPYMISWIKYNPQTEIKKLQIPSLLINGDKDIQVSVQDAQLLQQAKPNAQLHIISNMNRFNFFKCNCIYSERNCIYFHIITNIFP